MGELANLIGSTQLRLGEVLKDSISLDVASSTSRIIAQATDALRPPNINYKVLADNAASNLGKSVLASALVEMVGRSAAERAAFSLTSGLQIFDSVTSLIAGMTKGPDGTELTAKVLGASKLGLTASRTFSEIVKDMD